MVSPYNIRERDVDIEVFLSLLGSIGSLIFSFDHEKLGEIYENPRIGSKVYAYI